MNTEKKLTAVEWLEKEIRWNVSNSDKLIEIFRIAKEKEKQEIIVAHAVGRIKEISGILTNGDDYYNQTFKK